MLKNKNLCTCGSGKPLETCCEAGPQVKVWSKPLEHPGEYQEYLKKIEISSEFNMRYRGLFEFYGDDLIDYKLQHKNSIEFLTIFSSYLTTYLEDDCPPSWQDCQPSFWEELIFYYFPSQMTLTPQRKAVHTFFTHLRKFTRWLDKRAGTSFSPFISQYMRESIEDLKTCEHILYDLFLYDYPNMHQKHWDIQEELRRGEEMLSQFTNIEKGIFEVEQIIENIIVLIDIHTNQSYSLVDFPSENIAPGFLLYGVIGRAANDLFWEWAMILSAFPQRAKKYLQSGE